MTEFIDQIKLYLYLQAGLWRQLIDDLAINIDPLLLNLPKSGTVIFDGKIWSYRKHGLGVCFEEEAGVRKIDFHSVESGVDSFDAWGLSIYLGSLGKVGKKLLESVGISSGPYEDQLKDVLSRLEKEQIVVGDGRNYRFR